MEVVAYFAPKLGLISANEEDGRLWAESTTVIIIAVDKVKQAFFYAFNFLTKLWNGQWYGPCSSFDELIGELNGLTYAN